MESTDDARTITQKDALLTYLPLAAMWIIMGIEQPALTAIVARLPGATIQLAAFGVTFSLALVIESPILQMLAAGTAMAKDRHHYRRLLHFMHILGATLFSVHLLLSLPPVYYLVVGDVAGVPWDVVRPSRRAFFWMVLFAPAVGYRRLWQGMLIRYGKAKLVPITMIIRLAVTITLLAVGYLTQYTEGAQVAAISIVGGVVTGAVASYIFARPVMRRELPEGSEESVPTFSSLLSFYVPLALTSIVVLVSRPILTVAIAQAPSPVASLAVWPVLISFNFLFFSLALALQEVIIAKHRSVGDFYELRRFTARLAAVVGVVYLTVAVTPLRELWFRHVAGLSEDLLTLLPTPAAIMALSPAIAFFVFFFRGVSVQQERTLGITKGVLVNLVVLLAVGFSGAYLLPAAGVVSAALAFTLAILIESLYLRRNVRRQTFVFRTEPATSY